MNAQLTLGIQLVLICALLGVAFIIFKICNIIAWSWLWILAPFWIPIGISVILLVIACILYLNKSEPPRFK